ncbi:ubiE/COQ5 methyltransferase [Astrocystis sublimbata]|nr:ubiE/COQ5 methyltransferase [Astrocystis sublimbata]
MGTGELTPPTVAQLVPQGSVVGIDTSSSVVAQAQDLARSRGVGSGSNSNLTFQRHDANELPFSSGSFDIVYCHQVLHHVADPVAILREMARVTRQGGLVAAREVDYSALVYYPELPGVKKWEEVHMACFAANGAQPKAGRYVKSWAKEAGLNYEDITFSWGLWNYQDEEALVWGDSWAERALKSSYAKTALENGFASQEDLDGISETWRRWGREEGAFIIIPSGEILCRVR